MNMSLGDTQLIIAEAKKRGVSLQRLSYILATAYHETAHTMKPVQEAFWLSEDWRKKNLRYYPWHGRGYVQLTWDYNYKKAEQKLGIPFTKDPKLAMIPEHAVKILIVGMLEGWFTGKSVYDFIDELDEADQEDLREFANARRVVNGVDKQVEIGKLALQYEADLKEIGYASNTPVIVPEKPLINVDTPEPRPKEISSMTLLDLIWAFLKGLK